MRTNYMVGYVSGKGLLTSLWLLLPTNTGGNPLSLGRPADKYHCVSLIFCNIRMVNCRMSMGGRGGKTLGRITLKSGSRLCAEAPHL